MNFPLSSASIIILLSATLVFIVIEKSPIYIDSIYAAVSAALVFIIYRIEFLLREIGKLQKNH